MYCRDCSHSLSLLPDAEGVAGTAGLVSYVRGEFKRRRRQKNLGIILDAYSRPEDPSSRGIIEKFENSLSLTYQNPEEPYDHFYNVSVYNNELHGEYFKNRQRPGGEVIAWRLQKKRFCCWTIRMECV